MNLNFLAIDPFALVIFICSVYENSKIEQVFKKK